MNITFKRELDNESSLTEEKIIDFLLSDRKITDQKNFINPKSPLDFSLISFGFKKQLDITFKILHHIKEKGGKIVVYTDYDADGITGGTILWETLQLLGFNVFPYVPHRIHEGYGFSKKGIDHVKKEYDPSLIISVDHGITAAEKVNYAKSIGIPIIITDHHLKPDTLPDEAEAIFHLPEVSGSGLSYLFSKEIFNHFKDSQHPNYQLLITNYQTDYLALASIGTIADLVPLVGPSRNIVKHGLNAFGKIKRTGLLCIMENAGILGKPVTSYEIGFMIAPRINAVGRLEHAINALDLLCTTDSVKARQLATDIGRTNQERQDLVKKAVEEAKLQIEQTYKSTPNIIVLTSDTWHEGIIGLIASKIAEAYYRPTIIMTQSDGFLKGSARSIPSFHMTNYLRTMTEYLVDVGGHAQAAGFTIEKTKVEEFTDQIRQTSETLFKEKDLERKIEADLSIPLVKISRRLAKLIENLNPFGIGNPQPVFYSKAMIIDAKIFGKTGDHLKIFVQDINGNSFPLELIAFSKAKDFGKLSTDRVIEIVYQIEIDRWGGNEKLRGKLLYWQ